MARKVSSFDHPSREQPLAEDGAVLVKLVLSKSGGVRKATVLGDPTATAPAAIQAAKRWKYRHRLLDNQNPLEMMVEVTFPQDKHASPEIRQVLSAGVSGCIDAGPMASKIGLPPWFNTLFNEQPIIPILASESKK